MMYLPGSLCFSVAFPNYLKSVITVPSLIRSTLDLGRRVLYLYEVGALEVVILRDVNLFDQVLARLHQELVHGFRFLHQVLFLRVAVPSPEGGKETTLLEQALGGQGLLSLEIRRMQEIELFPELQLEVGRLGELGHPELPVLGVVEGVHVLRLIKSGPKRDCAVHVLLSFSLVVA